MKIIVSADDFGMSKSITDGIIYGLKKGFITSTSIIANLKHTDYAIEQAKLNGIKKVGIHCNLIIGKSLTDNPKLCFTENDNASLALNLDKFLKTVSYQEAKNEILAQYNYVVGKGLKINHLDNHLLLEIYPNIMQAMIDVAKEKNIPMRFWNSKLKKQINDAGVTTPDVICRDFHRNGVSFSTIDKLINENKNTENTIEIMTHVGFVDEYTYFFTNYNVDRLIELKTLEDYLNNGKFDKMILTNHDILEK